MPIQPDKHERIERHERPPDSWNVDTGGRFRKMTPRYTPEHENQHPHETDAFLNALRDALAGTEDALRGKTIKIDDDHELTMEEIWTRVAALKGASARRRRADPATDTDLSRARKIQETCARPDCDADAIKRWRGETPLCRRHYQQALREAAPE